MGLSWTTWWHHSPPFLWYLFACWVILKATGWLPVWLTLQDHSWIQFLFCTKPWLTWRGTMAVWQNEESGDHLNLFGGGDGVSESNGVFQPQRIHHQYTTRRGKGKSTFTKRWVEKNDIATAPRWPVKDSVIKGRRSRRLTTTDFDKGGGLTVCGGGRRRSQWETFCHYNILMWCPSEMDLWEEVYHC